MLELFWHWNFKREISFAVTFCLPIDILVKVLVQYEQFNYRMCKHAAIAACWPFNLILAVIPLLNKTLSSWSSLWLTALPNWPIMLQHFSSFILPLHIEFICFLLKISPCHSVYTADEEEWKIILNNGKIEIFNDLVQTRSLGHTVSVSTYMYNAWQKVIAISGNKRKRYLLFVFPLTLLNADRTFMARHANSL